MSHFVPGAKTSSRAAAMPGQISDADYTTSAFSGCFRPAKVALASFLWQRR
jgi:hypothetical protein